MIGKITYINHGKRFGFIESETLESIYFKTNQHFNNLTIGDDVTFKLLESKKGYSATALRKLYFNNSGIAFAARINNHHIHLDLDKYLPSMINEISDKSSDDFIEQEYEFPYSIGESICVPTSNNDEIVYGIRKGRLGHSRFVKGSKPQKSKHIFATYKKVDFGYLIITIFVGRKAGLEPYDASATSTDLLFWQKNALLFNEEEIIPGSLTKVYPWVLNQPAICKLK